MTTLQSDARSLSDLLGEAAWARRLARSLVADRDDAEDLVQETWISALRHPPSTERSLRPWLATVLRRHSVNRALASKRRSGREEAAVPSSESAPSAEALLERMEAQKLLAGLVTSLEEPYRQTVLLRFYEGLSSPEIAQRLTVPEGTVRWRLKTGLDQLRRRLDETSGGERERWRLALVPLGDRPARRTLSPGLPIVAGLTAVLALGGVALWTTRGAQPGAGHGSEGSTQIPALPSGPAGATVQVLAAAAVDDSCRSSVERLRKEVAASEAEALKTIKHEKLFARGVPDPAAEKELAAIIARIMKGDQPSAPAYTLECRTWVCKMTVAKTPDEATSARTNAWMLPLQRDPEMRKRTRGVGFHSRAPVKDPITGARIARQDVYIGLKDPSGKPFEGQGGPMADVKFGPLPSIEACRGEVAALNVRLAAAQAEIEADMGPSHRFARRGANATLTKEVTAEIIRIFDGEVSPPQAECRGLVCKIGSAEPSHPWQKRLESDSAFMMRVQGASFGKEIHFSMKTPEELAATRWLRKQLDDFVASAGFVACGTKHPVQGKLTLTLRLPATGKENDEGAVDRISGRMVGDLAESPLARCLLEDMGHTVLATRPPSPTAEGRAFKRLDLPFPATK